MTETRIIIDRLNDLGDYLADQVRTDFMQVSLRVGAQGTGRDGFSGLLSPLQGAMDELQALFNIFLDTALDKLSSTSGGLWATAARYQDTERGKVNTLDGIRQQPESR